jgi:NAD(P)-dependent dehydrogenase (short-subunit alcohol dehydrogenase family)
MQKVIIIGGTAGIGLATARLLASKHEVVVTGRDQERMQLALKGLKGNVKGVIVDAADHQALRELFSKHGPVDHVVIAAANHGGAMPFADITADALNAGIEGKLRVHILAAQAAAKVLAPQGSITFVSAVTAIAPIVGASLLAAINGAIAAMVPALAAELAPLRVNAVLPGVIDTEWWDWLPGDVKQQVLEGAANSAPVGRVGSAEDVASAIEFLISNTFTTGVLLPCDGGSRLVTGK